MAKFACWARGVVYWACLVVMVLEAFRTHLVLIEHSPLLTRCCVGVEMAFMHRVIMWLSLVGAPCALLFYGSVVSWGRIG